MTKGAGAVHEIVDRIDRAYPNASYALVWSTPWELLVGTILAGGSTDVLANKVTAALFPSYPNVAAFAAIEPETLEPLIKSVGFQAARAKAIVGSAKMIVERFAGDVPRKMDEMLVMPGVIRKSANVVLCCAYNVAEGIIVDTHIERIAPRIGLTRAGTPEAIERELMQIVPSDRWTKFGPGLILHGREVCKAKEPACDGCALFDVCIRAGLPGGAPEPAKKSKRKGAD
jgi:endonuclease III